MPASVIQAADVADLPITTLPQYERPRWKDISHTLQKFVMLPQMLQKKRKSVGGTGYNFKLKTARGQAAQVVGLFDTVQPTVPDLMQSAEIPHRYFRAVWPYDKREVMINSGAEQIVDIKRARRIDALGEIAELVEARAWGLPSPTNNDDIWGVQYHVVPNVTKGFNGGAAFGYTTKQGLNPTTYTGLKNYTDTYVNVSETDLFDAVREAEVKTNFMAPAPYPELGGKPEKAMYTGAYANVVLPMIRAARSQNQNLGGELAVNPSGEPTFHGKAVVWVPYLENNVPKLSDGSTDATDAIYGIDWSEFFPTSLKGFWMVEADASVGSQPMVTSTALYLSLNFGCTDYRSQWVMYKVS